MTYCTCLSVFFRVTECKITNANEDRTAYAIHSFDPAGTCYNNRLAAQQLSASPNIEIAFRSFRFTTDVGDTSSQYQKVRCKIHLDPSPSNSTAAQTPPDCSCYSPSECAASTSG